ncbi:aminopeptidase Ey-like [Chiloscyllium punctatum]|uniref:aminopeptidase Ey-like n=1 Tax=Chiloscyllium punctatum TaxID=137246 RepID=UPI003B636414
MPLRWQEVTSRWKAGRVNELDAQKDGHCDATGSRPTGVLRGGHMVAVETPRIRKAQLAFGLSAWVLLGLAAVSQASLGERTSWAPPAQVATPTQKPWRSARLPRSLRPVNYELELWPWLFREGSSGLFLFHGRSTVTFRCLEATNLVVIYSKMLNYTEPVRVKSGADRSEVPVARVWQETANDYLVLLLRTPLRKGRVYTLQAAYCGELTDELVGLYRVEYTEAGVTKLLAVTMMQPTDARRVFPCFDEPALKATFDLTVIHRPDQSAISNMPIKRVSALWIHGQEWTVTIFERTLKMSTYLLALVVSEFRFIEETYHGVQFKVWGRKEMIEAGEGDYALKVAGRLLEFFANKFDISYPLTKMDLVAVPSFESGGMENWGLIIFREVNLLYDAKEESESSLRALTLVLAHEFTHQWFGNLVTMRWWNDIWLNEGFATYFSYLGNSFVNPDWTVDSFFAGKSLSAAFSSDALAISHPLSPRQQEVYSIEHISQLFDDISYDKGASVLRMVSSFMTEELFLHGLTGYLREFSFRTANYTDLRTHLQQALDNQKMVQLPSNLASILDTWTLQMGYPVVTINTSSGLVTQQHFLVDHLTNVTRTSPYGGICAGDVGERSELDLGEYEQSRTVQGQL